MTMSRNSSIDGNRAVLLIVAIVLVIAGSVVLRRRPEQPAFQSQSDKTTVELVNELGRRRWKRVSFGGPYSGIEHNSRTRSIVAKGETSVPDLITHVANGSYVECVYSVFCLRQLKTADATAAVTKLQEDCNKGRRFPGEDLTLWVQCKFYLEEVGRGDLVSWPEREH